MKRTKYLAMIAAAAVLSIFGGMIVAAQEEQDGILVTEDGTHLFYEETQSDIGESVWGIEGVYSDTNVIRIPETIEGKKVYELFPDAIGGKDTVEEVYLPENMKVIASDQFDMCVSLRKVHLGGVQKFSGFWDRGTMLFWDCAKLESFSTGDSANFPIEATGYNRKIEMFYADILNNLKYIRIGSSMENVAENLFYGNSLEWVDIGDNNPLYRGINGVVYSADGKKLLVCGTAYSNSFYEIPEGVEEITKIGFSECKHIKKIKVPSTVCRGVLDWIGTSDITLQVEKYSYAYLNAVQTGKSYELYGNPQPHTHQYEVVVDQAATCGTPGSQHNVCKECMETQDLVVIPATGLHTYGAYVTTVPPTATQTGLAVRTCSVCGATETKMLDILPKQDSGQDQENQNDGTFGLDKQITVMAGESIALKPQGEKGKITYRSSNPQIAAVTSKGVVKGIKAGSAKITVKSDGRKAVVTVKVLAPTVKKITNVPKNKTLKNGKSFTLKPKFSPKGSSGKISYTSSNKKVAKVNAKGKVTAKKKGTAVITVKVGRVKAKCKVKVK